MKIIIAIAAWIMMPLALMVIGFEVAKAYAEDVLFTKSKE